ncbi:MAG TPA: hypothetical protein VN026_14070 [Bacteroidia bacterium]|jgi:hypothetical protein|nr:hypothetical protein [Bacteroidia bacterium]
MELIEFLHCNVELKKGVVWLNFKENSELDVKEIKQLIRAAEKLADKKPYLLMSDARVHLTITAEGRKVAADKKEAPLLLANAVIVNNLAVRVTANFFSSFNKPHFKFRVFNDEKKALVWLLKQK